MKKVSVIVPVYNPGDYMDDLVRSVLDQSLPASEYEAIFVDDGSTDGTGERLDALAAEHEQIRVEHIPNSGWPGRPRNVGMDMAQGEFVYFVDNDDWIGREALERMYAMAKADEADIVIGRVAGHGKHVPATFFARNRSGVTLEWGPLKWLLTPHKLFRKAFMDEHGLRFPEGRRRLEDHVVVMRAYFLTDRVSVLADYPCYHWMLRDREVNASWGRFDAPSYFDYVREVFAIVDEHTEPGRFRDSLYMRWYRGKMLNRLIGSAMLDGPQEPRRARHEEIRRLALERMGPGVDELLTFALRARSHLLKQGTFEQLEEYARFERQLRARVRVVESARDGGALRLRLEARLAGGEEPLRFRRDGDRVLWVPPASLAAAISAELLDATQALERSELHLALRSAEHVDVHVPVTVRARLDDAGNGLCDAVLEGEVVVDPAAAVAGSPLDPGPWGTLATVRLAGFVARARVRGRDRGRPLVVDVAPGGRLTETTLPLGARVKRRVAAVLPDRVLKAIRDR